MTLDALIAHLDGPYAPLPPAWDDPALLTPAHLALLDAAVAAPLPSPTWDAPRGVVIGAGGAKFFGCAWCAVAALRAVGCNLPVQFWYLGRGEMDPTMAAAAKTAGIELVDALAVAAALPRPPRILEGWPLKPFAMVNCRFKEAIYLDADCIVAANPEALLNTQNFRNTGAIFWPDLPPGDRAEWLPDVVWENCGMKPVDEPAFESGQFIIDREKCWRPLNVAMHINEHCDWYYRFVFGDKDTYHLAWRKCGFDYAMPLSRRAGWHNPAIQQHDFSGQLMFQHCTSGKDLLCAGEEIPCLRQKDVCVAAQRQLRELGFSGRIWDFQNDAAAAEIPGVYQYNREGGDTWQAIFGAGGGISPGADRTVKRWALHSIDGTPTLVIVGEAHKGSEIATTFLGRNGDGRWYGTYELKPRAAVVLAPCEPVAYKGVLPHRYKSIDGWFDFEAVYDATVAVVADGAKVVEVGCWLGKSSSYMATAIANSGKRINFYCVDTWQGSPTERYHLDLVAKHGGSLRGAFESNMRGLPYCAVEKPSLAAAAQFGDLSLDFVFIDASHEHKDVCNDIAAWYPKVKYGGVIAGHDVGWGGVMAAVQSRLPATEVSIVGSSWVHKKRACNEPDGGADCAGHSLLFIPVINRPDLLTAAVGSIPAGLQAVVLDMSAEGYRQHVPARFGYLRIPGGLSFTQVQNYMLRRAAAAGKRYLLFMHSDANCPKQSVTDLMRWAKKQGENWGVIWTYYDALAAFNVPALLAKVGFWDETFPWYRADCDYYHRIRKAGLERIDTGIQINHVHSATIGADPARLAAVQAAGVWAEDHYRHKWGGLQNEERYEIPYNGTV